MRQLRAILILFSAAATTLVWGQENFTYSRLERETVLKRLRKVVPDNDERRRLLAELFAEAGCSGDHLTEQPVPGEQSPNMVCTLPGETDHVILVSAHYDAAPDSEGIADNWTGAALLPSFYQSLKNDDRKHTYLFAAFAGASNDHAGARHYLGGLDKSDLEKYSAAVVVDTLGLSFTRGWADDRQLIAHLRTISSTIKLPIEASEYKDITGGARPFEKKKIPAITIHSVNEYNYDDLRNGEDTLDRINLYEYYESYMLAAMYLAYLDIKLD